LPPGNLTVTVSVSIPELVGTSALTKKLNDLKLLADARKYSNYYLFSISRWIQKKRILAWHDQLQEHCLVKSIDLQPTHSSTTEPDPEVLFDCLSIRDWRELAAYEMPSAGSAEQNEIGSGIGKDVDVSIGALPRRVDQASFAVAGLLVFTLLYFGAFLREAAHSDCFPAAGTLFGAFSRTPSTNLMMFAALLFPPIASLAVAIASASWVLYVESALVALATGWIFIGFQKKSYFTNSAAWIRAKLRLPWKHIPKQDSAHPDQN